MKSILEYDIWGNVTKFKDSKGFWVKQTFIDNKITEYKDSDGNYWGKDILNINPFPIYLLNKVFDKMYTYENFISVFRYDYYELFPVNISLSSDLTFLNTHLTNFTIQTNGFRLIIGSNSTLTNSKIYGNGPSLIGDNVTMTNCIIQGNGYEFEINYGDRI